MLPRFCLVARAESDTLDAVPDYGHSGGAFGIPSMLPPLVLPDRPSWDLVRPYIAPDANVPDDAPTHGILVTMGPWSIPVSYNAPCHYVDWGAHSSIVRTILLGRRTMSKPFQAGYHLEGRVSYGGRKLSAFSSELLVELDSGYILSIASIFVRSVFV